MSKKVTVNEEFIMTLQGGTFVKYEGLLDVAHQLGLSALTVQVLQFPDESNNFVAICEATGETEDGKIFVDIGDAAPNSVNRNLAPHLIRMASTRAKARVLRDLTNIGITALEELDLDVMNGKKEVQSQNINALMGKALGLQNQLMASGKGKMIAEITGGVSVESISKADQLQIVIDKLEKILE